MSHFGALRSRMMTPSPDNSKAEKRGFHVKDTATKELLERSPGYFRTGFATAMETGDPDATAARLNALEREFRGFAYEGGAMGLAILDTLPIGRSDRVARFIAGPAADYANAAHVGLGFALARAPKMRRRVIAPTDPLLRWRSLDGYGFHQAFFHTRQYVHEHVRDTGFPWTGGDQRYAGYAVRAMDHGIGRALWFVGGADIGPVTSLLDGYDAGRHADLWSGIGVAATYAGGATDRELELLAKSAGPFRRHLALGATLACYTRVTAGVANEHTGTAASVLCDMSPEQAAALAGTSLGGLPPDGDVPAYEIWRERLATRFASAGDD